MNYEKLDEITIENFGMTYDELEDEGKNEAMKIYFEEGNLIDDETPEGWDERNIR